MLIRPLRALAVALLSATALAADPVPLPPVVVPLPEDEAPPEAPARRDPSGALSVVDVEQRSSEAKDAAELIAETPGALVQDVGGAGQRKSLALRGASSNGVLVFLDGVPLNGPGGIADLSLLPAALLDRLEILRGGAGARYGSGGLGGVVNAVTRRPSAGARGTAELRYGSFDTASASASLSGPLWGGEALVLAHGLRTDGDFPFLFDPAPSDPANPLELRRRANNAAQLGGGLAKYRRRLGEWSVTAMSELLLDRRELAGTERNPSVDGEEQGQRLSAALHASRPLSTGELSARGYFKSEWTQLSGGFHAVPYAQRFESAGAALDGSLALWDAQLATASLEVGEERLEAPDVSPAWLRASALAMDEWMLFEGRLVLSPSIRLDGIATASAPAGAPRASGLLVSPKLGASLELPLGLELRANAGRSHRFPSMIELYVSQGTLVPNPTLRPESALYLDAGLLRRGDALDAGLTAFYGLYEDLIAYEYYPPSLARPYNFEAAQAGGVEAEAAARAFGAELDGSYTLTFSENLRADPRYLGKELPYRPRHRARARLAAGPEWLRARAEVEYQSAQYMNRAASLALPARAFVHLAATLRLSERPELRATVEVKNLLDVHAADFDGYPLPGRAFYVTLSSSFERTP